MVVLTPSPASAARRRFVSRLLGGVLMAALALAPVSAPAQTAVPREYQVKAVFLFNFLQFAEWPSAAFPEPDAPLCIGVLGDDPFGAALDEAVRGETIQGRRLVVRRSRRLEELQDCQLLFISKSEDRRIGQILARVEDRPVLTVSEVNGFARQGGVIAFYPEGKKVRFEINPANARRSGLKLSSQLIGLGRVVGEEVGGGA